LGTLAKEGVVEIELFDLLNAKNSSGAILNSSEVAVKPDPKIEPNVTGPVERVVGGVALSKPFAVFDRKICSKPNSLLPIIKAPLLNPDSDVKNDPTGCSKKELTVSIPAALVVYPSGPKNGALSTSPETVRLRISESTKLPVTKKGEPTDALMVVALAPAALRATIEAIPAVVCEAFLTIVEMADAEKIILVYPIFLHG
jgi:hypothetical protein